MRKKFITLAIVSSSLCIVNNQIANASLKDQYKTDSACSWEKSTYESQEKTADFKIVNMSPAFGQGENYRDRYCITSDKKVIKFSPLSFNIAGFSRVNLDKKNTPIPQKGKLGKSETYVNESDFSYYINEFAIEEGKLIKYQCKSTDTVNCSGRLNRYELGTKIGINNLKKTTNNYQDLVFEGIGKYRGEVKDGKMNGKGTFTWDKGGAVYTGDFKNNDFHGKGNLSYGNGDNYVGDFRNMKREGFGKYMYKNGAIFEGKYVNNEAEGVGTYTDENGNSRKGTWANGKFVKWN